MLLQHLVSRDLFKVPQCLLLLYSSHDDKSTNYSFKVYANKVELVIRSDLSELVNE